MPERLFLIDGSAFAFRSFFAIRGLTDSQGRPTNAVYGFARLLMKLLREHEPSHIAVVLDAPGKTFREDLYPQYKANRPPTPPELIAQMPRIEELVRAFAVPVLRVPGVEADDVMGTLARRAEETGLEVALVTGDKDMLQLVSDRVRVFDPGKETDGVWLEAGDVVERFGVGPAHVIDSLALMGDSADNVPGVRKVGPVAARKLLTEYGSLEGVYKHLDEIKGKTREYLEADREMAFLSRRLVTIDTGLELGISLDALRRREPDLDVLAETLSRFEFESLLAEVLPEAASDEQTDYRLVLDRATLERAVAEMRAAGVMAVDTETTSTDPMRARLVGVSMCCASGRAYYVPVGHTSPAAASGELDFEGDSASAAAAPAFSAAEAVDALRPLLEDPAVAKLGHNIKYDLIVLERAGIRIAGIRLDTMVASYLTDPSRMRHNLDEVCLHYLKRKTIPISDLIGKGSKQITFDQVPLEAASVYACEDADMTWRLGEVFTPLLRERGLEELLNRVELPLIPVLARMEQAGVALDVELFGRIGAELQERLRALETEIFEAAGAPFQINSPKQLQEVLFGKLGLKPLRRTKTGYSTDVEVLEELAIEHPLPGKILEYRTLDKLRGTYVEALPRLVHPETGRLHTSFNQAVAATGRLSSSDPNLQNIPVRTEIGRRLRQGFVAGARDRRLVSADYSQIELRILAHLSGDAALREAFEKDLDVHRDTAARVFGVAPDAVTPDMRRQAKAVNFGVVYGISAFGLARNLGISRSAAGEFIDHYFQQYPGVRAWIDATLEGARTTGYVTTLLDRRRYIHELNSGDQATRKAAERVAVNTPVQGSAADMIKLAMVRLDAELRGTRARLLLQVHDELLVEVPAEDAEALAALTRKIMEEAVPLDVPVRVDTGIGDHWAEIH